MWGLLDCWRSRDALRRAPPLDTRFRPLRFELLECRRVLSVTFQVDYSYDTNNFFNTQTKRDVLQAAINDIAARIADDLDAIVPSGGNTWQPAFTHPGTGNVQSLPTLTVPADTIIVYAGGYNLPGSTVGLGGYGGFVSGSAAWITTVLTRGEGTRDEVRNPSSGAKTAIEFAPWGGSLTFDTLTNWHFSATSPPPAGQTDFYSVAQHEIGHLLGFGTSDSFANRVAGAVGHEIGVWRAGQFYLDISGNYSWDGAAPDVTFGFGAVNDRPLTGDWNGDGFDEIGVWRNGVFYLDLNGNLQWDGPVTDRQIAFGAVTDTPLVGDWNGNGVDDIGVWREGNFYLDLNGNQLWDGPVFDRVIGFGATTDTPLVGDWNGNGVDDLGVWRSGVFFLDANGNRVWDGSGADWIAGFGATTDVPLIGDWDGDGADQIGVWRQGLYFQDYNGNLAWDGNSVDAQFAFGSVSDTPLVGDWLDSFQGAMATAEYDQFGSPPLFQDLSHWRQNLTDGGLRTAMEPSLTVGTRRAFTPLDFAALDDLGWTIVSSAPSAMQALTVQSWDGDFASGYAAAAEGYRVDYGQSVDGASPFRTAGARAVDRMYERPESPADSSASRRAAYMDGDYGRMVQPPMSEQQLERTREALRTGPGRAHGNPRILYDRALLEVLDESPLPVLELLDP
jgi:hypothetical protein